MSQFFLKNQTHKPRSVSEMAVSARETLKTPPSRYYCCAKCAKPKWPRTPGNTWWKDLFIPSYCPTQLKAAETMSENNMKTQNNSLLEFGGGLKHRLSGASGRGDIAFFQAPPLQKHWKALGQNTTLCKCLSYSQPR